MVFQQLSKGISTHYKKIGKHFPTLSRSLFHFSTSSNLNTHQHSLPQTIATLDTQHSNVPTFEDTNITNEQYLTTSHALEYPSTAIAFLSNFVQSSPLQQHSLPSACNPQANITNKIRTIELTYKRLLLGTWSSRILALKLRSQVLLPLEEEYPALFHSSEELTPMELISINESLVQLTNNVLEETYDSSNKADIFEDEVLELLQTPLVNLDILVNMNLQATSCLDILFVSKADLKNYSYPFGLFLTLMMSRKGPLYVYEGVRSSLEERCDHHWLFNRVKDAAIRYFTDYAVHEINVAEKKRLRLKISDNDKIQSLKVVHESLINDLDKFLSESIDLLFMIAFHYASKELQSRTNLCLRLFQEGALGDRTKAAELLGRPLLDLPSEDELFKAFEISRRCGDSPLFPFIETYAGIGEDEDNMLPQYELLTEYTVPSLDTMHSALRWKFDRLYNRPRTVLLTSEYLPTLEEASTLIKNYPIKLLPWESYLISRCDYLSESELWTSWTRSKLDVVAITKEFVKSLSSYMIDALGRLGRAKTKGEVKIAVVGPGSRVLSASLNTVFHSLQKEIEKMYEGGITSVSRGEESEARVTRKRRKRDNEVVEGQERNMLKVSFYPVFFHNPDESMHLKSSINDDSSFQPQLQSEAENVPRYESFNKTLSSVMMGMLPSLAIFLSIPEGADWTSAVESYAFLDEYIVIGLHDTDKSGMLNKTWGHPLLLGKPKVNSHISRFKRYEENSVSSHVLCSVDTPGRVGFGSAYSFRREK